jgi:hypothetical protein
LRTTLESGAWIEHTPIQELKGIHRRKLERAGKPRVSSAAIDDSGQVNVGALMAGVDFGAFAAVKRDALWALLIERWSYDFPVPQLEETDDGLVAVGDGFDEIPLDDYDEIESLFEPFAKKLNRRPNPKARAAATTTASNGSSRASAAHGSPTG